MKKLVVYDLDGTLAESKSSLDGEMAEILTRLLGVARVAIISGGDWPQYKKQLLANLPGDEILARLTLLPTCGTKYYRYEGSWTKVYSEDLTEAEKRKILDSFQSALDEAGFRPAQTWGEIIEDRGSQITFSALGQQAPLAEKEKWDPDFAKRQQIKAILDRDLAEFSVRLGGSTSIDVTKPGIDKAYGIEKLRELLNIELDEMIFVGDAIFPGGNDYAVKEAGVDSIQVRDPGETKRVTEAIIACLKV